MYYILYNHNPARVACPWIMCVRSWCPRAAPTTLNDMVDSGCKRRLTVASAATAATVLAATHYGPCGCSAFAVAPAVGSRGAPLLPPQQHKNHFTPPSAVSPSPRLRRSWATRDDNRSRSDRGCRGQRARSAWSPWSIAMVAGTSSEGELDVENVVIVGSGPAVRRGSSID